MTEPFLCYRLMSAYGLTTPIGILPCRQKKLGVLNILEIQISLAGTYILPSPTLDLLDILYWVFYDCQTKVCSVWQSMFSVKGLSLKVVLYQRFRQASHHTHRQPNVGTMMFSLILSNYRTICSILFNPPTAKLMGRVGQSKFIKLWTYKHG